MSKKITTETYKEELKELQLNIEVIGAYISAKTPIKHKCLICEHEWDATPNNIKRGKGCPKCGLKKRSKTRTLTTEQFLVRYKDAINKNVQVVGEYHGSKSQIRCRCLVCGQEYYATASVVARGGMHSDCMAKINGERLRLSPEDFVVRMQNISPTIEILSVFSKTDDHVSCRCMVCGHKWSAKAGNLLNGRGCPKCSYAERGKNCRISQDEYVKRLSICNPNVVLIGSYTTMSDKILHKCLTHNVEWDITPANALQGQGCFECQKEKISISNKKSNETYLAELSLKNPYVVPLEEYKGAGIKILHRYKKCGHEYMVTPDAVLQGGDCNICAKQNAGQYNLKDNNTYLSELKFKNPLVEPLEPYQKANVKILHRCKIDGYEWYAVPSSILAGHGCPLCNMSMGEKRIRVWLDQNHINYIPQKFFLGLEGVGGGLLTYDFFLPEHRIAIEFQGEQHKHPIHNDFFGGKKGFEVQSEHDKRKREYAQTHNIKLLEIWYYDIDNIEKILKENLNSESVETTGGM